MTPAGNGRTMSRNPFRRGPRDAGEAPAAPGEETRAADTRGTDATRTDPAPTEATRADPGTTDAAGSDARTTDAGAPGGAAAAPGAGTPSAGRGGEERTVVERPAAEPTAERRPDPDRRAEPVAARDHDATAVDRPVTEVMRVPGFAPVAPIGGWLAAWGATTLAAVSLTRAGLDLGFGLGVAEGGPGESGFFPGLWLLLVQAGAFLIGGYVAARMARGRGATHAVLAWVVAMLATGADAIVQNLRDSDEGVLAAIPWVPFWEQTGMGSGIDAAVALGALALAGLVGAILGGTLGAAGNRAARREVPVDHGTRPAAG